jgi:hypothetical protein
MRARKPEVGEDAVTEELRDVALEAADLTSHGVLVNVQQLSPPQGRMLSTGPPSRPDHRTGR